VSQAAAGGQTGGKFLKIARGKTTGNFFIFANIFPETSTRKAPLIRDAKPR
jgi:hypothetical protein